MSAPVCRGGVDLLMDYLEHVVSAEERAALEAHVASCQKCAAFIRSYLATPRILREATIREAPASLQERLLAALRAERHN